ncbi:class D beta-lactamase [Aquabacter sp. L1I39]|uniref:class D beta-lactamase n=1 Tax=Aquabacter sp. L1I39 TaxID=2820278 RepID=UPI001ADCD30E|nr:class D beta-lactamase [Aquabacter sp. L1I39]QTL03117.1 class D beta-lactamase [Aquabacter sp. L1I39]
MNVALRPVTPRQDLARLGRQALLAVSALAAVLFAAGPARAVEECFLVAEVKTGHVAAKQGLCATRQSPASTFKVPLALMGFDSGILKSPDAPVWTSKAGMPDWMEQWKGPQTPKSWMQYSVVWYSQLLTQELGMDRFRAYVRGFDYGNQNLSGDPGKDNGLTRAWLSSSLRISPREQVDFLRRLLKGELPVSPEAVDKTITILKVPESPAGWDLYGKTGTGFQQLGDGSPDRQRPFGWFIGWAEKGGRQFAFARFITLDYIPPEPLGPMARRQAVKALEPILTAQEK